MFADIEMPGMSGYELADLIHSHALNVDVVFVTGNSGYAVHAFDLNVHDYIMKPYQADRIAKSLERYMSTKQEKVFMDGFSLSSSQIFTCCKRRMSFLLSEQAGQPPLSQQQEISRHIRH